MFHYYVIEYVVRERVNYLVRGVGFEPTQAYAIGAPTIFGPEPDPFDLARAPPPIIISS